MEHISFPEGVCLVHPWWRGDITVGWVQRGALPIGSQTWLEQMGILRLGKVWLCQVVCSASRGTEVAAKFFRIFFLLLIC